MIGAPKLIFQVTPAATFLGVAGLAHLFGAGSSVLQNEIFWVAAMLGLSSNIVLGTLATSRRDHAAIAAIAMTIGFWSWVGLNPASPPTHQFDVQAYDDSQGCTF